jgi:hypothetical protein
MKTFRKTHKNICNSNRFSGFLKYIYNKTVKTAESPAFSAYPKPSVYGGGSSHIDVRADNRGCVL